MQQAKKKKKFKSWWRTGINETDVITDHRSRSDFLQTNPNFSYFPNNLSYSEGTYEDIFM
jgi:hypothetical protein